MKQNTSAERQNELLRELLALQQSRSKQLEELDSVLRERQGKVAAQFESQRQQFARQNLIQRDGVDTAYKAELVKVREELTLQSRRVKNEFEEKVAAANKHVKTAKSDGEYDWFLSKQRLKKEYEADRLETQESYKKFKAKLKSHGVAFNEVVTQSKAALAAHRSPFKVQGGDLLEDPGDSDHLAEHLNTHTHVKELTRQFHRSFWVRFQEDRWYLIAFLVGIVASTYPLQLWLNNVVFSGVAAAIVGVLSSVVAYYVSRTFATKTAQQFRPTFIDAIASGKKQLLAAQHQNKKQRNAHLARLLTDTNDRAEVLDQEWKAAQAEMDSRLEHREQELATWSEKASIAIEEKRQAQEKSLALQFEPQIEALTQELDSETQRLTDTEEAEVQKNKSEYESKKTELLADWTSQSASILTEFRQMNELANATMFRPEQDFEQWNPPTVPPDVVRFGTATARLDDTAAVAVADTGASAHGTASDHSLVHSQVELPAVLDLVHAPSLILDTTSDGRPTATRILKSLMLRLLTSIPVGKLQFTIIDPIGMGQDFSAFMHLGDHDEQLINQRIWTETGDINSRLAEHTQHIENIIQTYLRNEFDSIQQYNEHAGEVAEAFRVLVVANFPTGFSDEAAKRLAGILQSGPRCGVFAMVSVDSSQKMPRDFDADDLRRAANVVTVDGEDARWSEEPLSKVTITLDELPTETKFSEAMHKIGALAKKANRVEVPFRSVAPAADDWWNGDGRAELSVALGRAGATKLKSLTLGHGTSQHVLISGKTGSGKSTLLHAIIVNLSLKYSPNEVQFYLIDFKKGVEFKSYAEHQLPHAKVIAIESEREFGQSVLQRLDAELRRRGDLFRRVGVQSLAGYRDARPDEHLPRVLLIIDEFQEFFVKEDKIAQDASLLLDRLVRQGRAFGIHVLLGSQTLAGAYSLARATIGQMAVRIALQCSATDAHLILSDDNDAARTLRRPGEAIYNDANGMVEGNHPFQVVWLSDIEKEDYLRKIYAKHQSLKPESEPPIVFEGNVSADVARNELLRKSWASPAPTDIPLAPRAWLGEAIAIKEAPAAIFHRRSGANVVLVGQQEEAALGIMASSLLSLASFSPTTQHKRSRFLILDGIRPESTEAGYWNKLKETSGLDISVVKPREATDVIHELAAEVAERHQQDADDRCATFLFVYNLSRFRDLQKSEDDFGFGSFGEEKQASPAEELANILREGPLRGVHTIIWSDTYTNLMRWIDRQSLRDIDSRVLFQMSATDSSNLMDSSAASQLGMHRAIFYSEDQGRAERFRPYGLPDDDYLLSVRASCTSLNRTAPSPRVEE